MSELRDGQLLKRYLENGSEGAFTELGQRYARLVFATCLRELGERGLAEDASQAVFLLLARKAASLQKQDTLGGWLFTASRLVSQNLRRQERRRKAYEEKAMIEMPVQANEENHLWETIEPHLNEALAHLKPRDREAILLRFFEEKTLAETGSLLNLSENTARMKVNRALEKLRLHLAKAGVVVSGTLLVSLLTQNSAEALSLVPPSLSEAIAHIATGKGATQGSSLSPSALPLAQGAGHTLLKVSLIKSVPLLLLGSAVLVTGGIGLVRLITPKVTPETRKTVFTALAGNWEGTLEYADDGDGVHHTYPTTLKLTPAPDAETLTYRATYLGSDRVDSWTGTLDLKTGNFVTTGVQDGVAKRLTYEVTGLKAFASRNGGTLTLTTHDNLAHWDTTQTITRQGNRLTWGEDVRSGTSPFRFRNLFTLTKTN